MQKTKTIALLLVGFILGFLICDRFFVPKIESKVHVIERIKTDTVYQHIRDTITLTKNEIRYIYERDTIIENYEPKIRGFKKSFPITYGNVYFSGEVLGELKYTSISHDLRLPVVTNTIEKETTRTIVQKPSGIYLVGGASNNFSTSIGAIYLRDRSLIGYDYSLSGFHSVKVGYKIL